MIDCNSYNKNKYEYKHICYDLNNIIINKNYYCDIICSEKNIFETARTKHFDIFCGINIFQLLSCDLYYNGKKNGTKEKENELKDIILEKIEKNFISNEFNRSGLYEGKDQIIKYNNMEVTLTTTESQKKIIEHNKTAIDFTECEKLLRKHYNISDNGKLFMIKIDTYQEGIKIPKIEYNIYSNLNNTNLFKLNLSICDKIKIDLFFPVIITEKENIDEYNQTSGYYNDICYPAQSETNSDITIMDRQKEFINKNKLVCQENCVFTEYNYKTHKAKCSCEVKESSFSSIKMVINITEIYESFKNIKKIMNIGILKCYKVLFTKDGIIKNLAFYLIIIIILLHFIFIIIFYNKDLNIINSIIEDIAFAINNWELVYVEDKEYDKNLKKDNNNNNNNNLLCVNKKKKKKSKSIVMLNNKSINDNKIIRNKRNKNRNNTINVIKNNTLKREKREKNCENNSSSKFAINQNSMIEKTKKIMEYNQEEKNELLYENAIKYDNRTYCEYYISLIQTKHTLVFSFCYNKDYNSRIIKKDLFFNSFVIYFTINALFFNDETIHQIYEDKGKFLLLYQLPKIIYSTLISSVLNIIFKGLALSKGSIIEFKSDKNKKDLNQREKNLKSKLTIKFILYFIISSIYLFLFWYYLSLFCAIYRNTQKHLIKDTLISFGLSFIEPFFLYLLPGLFRIPALKNKKDQKTCLYNISKIFQKFL